MRTLNDLDLFCTDDSFASVQREVVYQLKQMGLENLSAFIVKSAEEKEHIETVVEYFGCSDMEDVAELCDNFEIDRTEDYIHTESISDYVREEIDPMVSNFTDAMNTNFTYIMEESDHVRRRFGKYILDEENLDALRSLLHEELSNAGLE